MTQPSAVPSQRNAETFTTPATSVAGATVVPSTVTVVAPSSSAPTTAHKSDASASADRPSTSYITAQHSPTLNWSTSSSSAPGLGDTVNVAVCLIIVIALIIGLGLLVKRFSVGSLRRGEQRVLKTIDTQAVGSKERIAVMEVNDTWLVVGITPQGISALHAMPRPDDQATDVAASTMSSTTMSSTTMSAATMSRAGMPFAQALREAARTTFGRKESRGQKITDRDTHNDRNDHA